MCLCVAAITQFQDLALCVHMSLCNPTHLTDDVRLALSVSSEPVFIRLSMCVCIQCGERNVWYCFLGSKGKCKQRKVVAKGEWKSVGVHVCVRWREDDISGWAESRRRGSGQCESRVCHTDVV